MSKAKHFKSMSKRSRIEILSPTSKSQKAARKRIREEFSPHVLIEANPQSYLVAFRRPPSSIKNKPNEKSFIYKNKLKSVR